MFLIKNNPKIGLDALKTTTKLPNLSCYLSLSIFGAGPGPLKGAVPIGWCLNDLLQYQLKHVISGFLIFYPNIFLLYTSIYTYSLLPETRDDSFIITKWWMIPVKTELQLLHSRLQFSPAVKLQFTAINLQLDCWILTVFLNTLQ